VTEDDREVGSALLDNFDEALSACARPAKRRKYKKQTLPLHLGDDMDSDIDLDFLYSEHMH